MRNIRILKLFSRPKEGEMINSIIVYNRVPYIATYEAITDTTKITEYKSYLRINLWFLLLDFNWNTKNK